MQLIELFFGCVASRLLNLSISTQNASMSAVTKLIMCIIYLHIFFHAYIFHCC